MHALILLQRCVVLQLYLPVPLVRECRLSRDMGSTLDSRVSAPLGRHGVLVWAGFGRTGFFMLCYALHVTAVCYAMSNESVVARVELFGDRMR